MKRSMFDSNRSPDQAFSGPENPGATTAEALSGLGDSNAVYDPPRAGFWQELSRAFCLATWDDVGYTSGNPNRL